MAKGLSWPGSGDRLAAGTKADGSEEASLEEQDATENHQNIQYNEFNLLVTTYLSFLGKYT